MSGAPASGEGDARLFAIAPQPFDIAPLRAPLLHERAGAFAAFEGWVRDHNDGRAVLGLRYDAYVELAEAEGRRIVRAALDRFGAIDACCVHRVGELAIGELAVWVGVSAAHRDAAFDACRWIIDEVKAHVPIWKHERYADGDADWLHPRPADPTAPGR
ncbi:molybdenum cofactor biosynthesis protein MoaE [Luteimonas kalidii]|uniref:Molybdopterin synthase catalytic subunit n=1 Tax=Luteimonas kalidii TaxID=3042025 RepID=A0ABT6JVL6_9GAMM|nr:molybdenum cofactor biosynthesis protein MoaE [Luteimonas kalidii]MDH5834731.1 molybdenum cofactor biosynthesis protein MoaE [Luteimonas kalidii]